MSISVRPLDHAVLAARDLAGLRARYERLGFQVGPENWHPWGTHNHIIQFDGTFLELIAPGQTAIAAADEGKFGQFVRSFVRDRDGLAMLALNSADAEADARSFAQSGIGQGAPFRFERMAQSADGSPAPVGFALAFAASKLLPGLGFFTCAQLRPENFWRAELQSHPNGASALRGLVIVARDPADHAEFLSHFTGRRDMVSTSMGIELQLGPHQSLDVMTPVAAQFRYGDALPKTRADLPIFACLRITVRDLAATRAVLASNSVPYEERQGALVVSADVAGGTAIAFEAP
jgi:hypothetical protein